MLLGLALLGIIGSDFSQQSRSDKDRDFLLNYGAFSASKLDDAPRIISKHYPKVGVAIVASRPEEYRMPQLIAVPKLERVVVI
jgi:hypothetical protein